MSPERSSETPTLYTGLLTRTKRFIISPDPTEARLFSRDLQDDPHLSYDDQAHGMLLQRKIFAERNGEVLTPSFETVDRGVLLREQVPINIREHGFSYHSAREIATQQETAQLRGSEREFLRLIMQHMN